MKTLKNFILVLTIPALFLFGCSKERDSIDPALGSGETTQMVLGKKLENPYSIKNMRKAYSALSSQTKSSIQRDEIDDVIYTTHYYVKFIPKTEDELGLMKCDSTIIFYPYPLDYEIISYGEYHDPTVPEGQPTYYYASIPVDKKLTNEVEWVILEELYIPDEYSEEDESVIRTRSGLGLNESFIENLVDKALEITGNEEPQTLTTRAKRSWRPSGYITYFDDATNRTIGLEGIKVKARRWFTTHTGIVYPSGLYLCDGTFKRPANYSFDFERAHFAVMSGNASYPYVDGPKKTGSWDYRFSKTDNPYYYFYATAFRASYHYCNKDIGGLNRPPQAKFLRAKIKVKCIYENNVDVNGRFTHGTFIISGKGIRIYNPNKRCDEIYGTTIHELAHSAHWLQNRSFFQNKVSLIVAESWASGVEMYLTRKVYPNYKRDDIRNYSRGGYTGIIEDLMDGTGLLKESSVYYKSDEERYRSYIDNVSGYSIKQIEDAIRGAGKWDEWKNNLKKLNNATKNNLDAAFDYWTAY